MPNGKHKNMVRHSRILIIFFFLFLIPSFLLSQRIKKFSEEVHLYPSELKNFLGPNLNQDEKDLFQKFEVSWDTANQTSLFSEDERMRIIDISNKLLKRKARAVPHFIEYMTVILSFKETSTEKENYDQWEKGFKQYIDNKKITLTSLSEFMKISIDVLNHNYLYQSYSVEWKSLSSNYYFKLEDDNLRIYFDETDLVCYSKRDSVHIYNTKGYLDPIEVVWYGSKGEVTWERAGYERSQVYAELGNYSINVKKSYYDADSVKFTNKNYFNEPLMGVLTEKVQNIREPGYANYPKFQSYQVNFKLDNIYDNINYTGGLSMEGAKLIGSGNQEEDACLTFFHNENKFMSASSKRFIIKEDRVAGINTSIVIYLGKEDSIYHPDLKLDYRVHTNELSLLKTNNFTSKAAYFNSYHNIDMNFEQLYYIIGEPRLHFRMMQGSAIGRASFKSFNYFNYRDFEELQRLDPVHPLYALKKFSQKFGYHQFPAMDYADFMRLPIHMIRQQLMELAYFRINRFVVY